MDLAKLDRELKALDALELRLNRNINPSPVLLRQIAARRNELLNPKETPSETPTRK